ncbi:MarR family winged helix-turn-helix transcriptional regulator [Sneathiella sp.]|uniref:MarR family winged helix-turn-helix transcriptional regulator n=1 Tax=Sneathiella sp. TaxID=1964365 RepID=UPI00261400EF|nr:MarR family transcriptional regulator [Sneathiella sp.]MDF2367729.1 MarR family transcriptional regulator [Sneathiella sp.]
MSLVLEEFLPYRFNRLAETLSRNASVAYKSEYGLSRSEWRAFALLGQKGTMTATEISYYSTMHKTKVSRAIFALEKKRWLAREVDETDRRLERITLTAQGEKAYENLVPKMQGIENELIARLGKQNSEALFKGLAALEKLYLDKETASRSQKAG